MTRRRHDRDRDSGVVKFRAPTEIRVPLLTADSMARVSSYADIRGVRRAADAIFTEVLVYSRRNFVHTLTPAGTMCLLCDSMHGTTTAIVRVARTIAHAHVLQQAFEPLKRMLSCIALVRGREHSLG